MNLINFAFAQNITSPVDLVGFIQEYCRSGVNLNFCLQGIYNLLVAIAVAVAFFSFLFGAFENLLSTIPDVKMQGKNRMKNALIGLAIIFISGVFLYWINPSIFNARLIMYKVTNLGIQQLIINIESNDEATITLDEVNKEKITFSETDLVIIPANLPGIILSKSGMKIWKEALDPLKRAGELAHQKGYKLLIISAYRDINHQKELWENAIKKYGSPEIAKKYVAPPGNSAHNYGKAVDVNLIKNGARYCNKELENIMCTAGWIRYNKECWHFEYGTKRWENGKVVGKCAM